jgi:phage/plasmid-like protein (TIGR03299 family)
MAHELLIENGKAAMMYVGEKAPWHGLGQKLDKPATSAEAIKAAHLDWEVAKVPLYMKGRKQYRPVKAKYAVVRTDQPQPEPMGIVAENYQPLQNREAFTWFDEIVGHGAAIYHTAGALGNGERVWVLAKLPGEIRVKGEDVSEKFLLLSNSHDGESSVQVKFTPIRVVCQNTLTMALSSGQTVKISHTRSLKERMEAAKENLGIIHEQFLKIEKDFQQLAEIQIKKAGLDEYLAAVFPMPSDDKDTAAINRVTTARQKSGQLFETGRGNGAEKVRGTLWAAYNGIAEFVDYGSTRRDASQRLESIWFGSGYLTKARAFNVAGKKAAEWKN